MQLGSWRDFSAPARKSSSDSQQDGNPCSQNSENDFFRVLQILSRMGNLVVSGYLTQAIKRSSDSQQDGNPWCDLFIYVYWSLPHGSLGRDQIAFAVDEGFSGIFNISLPDGWKYPIPSC